MEDIIFLALGDLIILALEAREAVDLDDLEAIFLALEAREAVDLDDIFLDLEAREAVDLDLEARGDLDRLFDLDGDDILDLGKVSQTVNSMMPVLFQPP